MNNVIYTGRQLLTLAKGACSDLASQVSNGIKSMVATAKAIYTRQVVEGSGAKPRESSHADSTPSYPNMPYYPMNKPSLARRRVQTRTTTPVAPECSHCVTVKGKLNNLVMPKPNALKRLQLSMLRWFIARIDTTIKKDKNCLILHSYGNVRDFPFVFSETHKLSQTHAIDYVLVSCEEEFFKMLTTLPEDKQYDVVSVIGHGDHNGVALGSYFFGRRHRKKTEVTPHMSCELQMLGRKIKEKGKVIFQACHCGSGKKNVALNFSKVCPQATVYASKSLHHMLYGLNLQNDASAKFRSPLGFDATFVCRGGEPVTA